MLAKRSIFFLGCLFCFTPWASAPLALTVGIVLALLNLTAFEKESKTAAKYLIQISIVLLGFSIELSKVAKAGLSGLGFAAGTIALVAILSLLLGKLLKTETKLTALLGAGTAICGGSAIAATGAVIGATSTHISISTAIVFLFNACGVYAYPFIGHWLGLSQEQFGVWAAVGIHDTAGVVAAGKAYGDIAFETATVIKLTRVLWIVPVALAIAWWVRRQEAAAGTASTNSTKTPIPWFILWFLLASALRSFVPFLAETASWLPASASTPADALKFTGKLLLTLALFLIGTGLSRKALASVGIKPLIQALIMWLVVSAVALTVVRTSSVAAGLGSSTAATPALGAPPSASAPTITPPTTNGR